jgi:AsmA protein
LRFDLSRIELKDLRARVEDALTGVKGEIVVESLVSGRLADKTETPLKLKAQFALQSPALRGNLSGETQIALDLGNRGVALRDMALVFKGDAPGAHGVDATLKGSLAWSGDQDTLLAENLALDGTASLGAFKLGGSSLTLQRFAFDPKQRSLALSGLALRLQAASPARALKLALDWPRLDVKGKTLEGSALSGSLALEGALQLTGTFASGAPRGDFERVIVPGFETRLNGAMGSRTLSGTLASELALQPADGALTLGKIGLALKLQGAGSPGLEIGLQGEASASASQARWALGGQLAGSNFSTRGNAVLTGKVPVVQAQARFDALDLNALAPPSKPGEPATATAKPDTPVDMSALRSVNGRFDLRAASLTVRTLHLRDAVLEAALEGGRLRVDTLRGKAWGGSIEASGSADANADRVALKALASGVDINALEKEATGHDVLEGTGRVALDVQASGRTTGEMKSGLQGTASMQLRDGAVKGINLAKSLRQARAALASRKDASTSSAQTEKTDFSELSVSFRLTDGVAHSTDLDVKSPFLRIGGAGAVDIGKGSIDYTARTTVVAVPVGQDGADLAALRGLTVPVHLSGALEAIQWRIEWSAIALAAMQNQLKGLLDRGLRPAGEGASSPTGPATTNPRKELADRLLKGLFK